MSDSTGAWSAPGWYPDPSGKPGTRWWDGTRWTDHLAAPAEGGWATQPHNEAAAPVEDQDKLLEQQGQWKKRTMMRVRGLAEMFGTVMLTGVLASVVPGLSFLIIPCIFLFSIGLVHLISGKPLSALPGFG